MLVTAEFGPRLWSTTWMSNSRPGFLVLLEVPWPTLGLFMGLLVGSSGQGKSISVTNRRIGARSWVPKGTDPKVFFSG